MTNPFKAFDTWVISKVFSPLQDWSGKSSLTLMFFAFTGAVIIESTRYIQTRLWPLFPLTVFGAVVVYLTIALPIERLVSKSSARHPNLNLRNPSDPGDWWRRYLASVPCICLAFVSNGSLLDTARNYTAMALVLSVVYLSACDIRPVPCKPEA